MAGRGNWHHRARNHLRLMNQEKLTNRWKKFRLKKKKNFRDPLTHPPFIHPFPHAVLFR